MAESSKTKALLRWLTTFEVEANSTIQVSDGVAMATVLHRIDSNHFNAGLLSKIKSDVPPDNKHLKVNNLRKILGAIVEYNDELPFVSLTEFPLPNVNLAAEGQ